VELQFSSHHKALLFELKTANQGFQHQATSKKKELGGAFLTKKELKGTFRDHRLKWGL